MFILHFTCVIVVLPYATVSIPVCNKSIVTVYSSGFELTHHDSQIAKIAILKVCEAKKHKNY